MKKYGLIVSLTLLFTPALSAYVLLSPPRT